MVIGFFDIPPYVTIVPPCLKNNKNNIVYLQYLTKKKKVKTLTLKKTIFKKIKKVSHFKNFTTILAAFPPIQFKPKTRFRYITLQHIIDHYNILKKKIHSLII